MSDTRLPADEVLDAVQPAGKTAGFGASTRERIEQAVEGYHRVNETTVTADQLRRDLRFYGFPDEFVDAIVTNIFTADTVHVYPPYDRVDEVADHVHIGDRTWSADNPESWVATRWTRAESETELNTTRIHDKLRKAINDGDRVVVEAAGETLFERETPPY